MDAVPRARSRPIALIVEAQLFFVPFLAALARAAGMVPIISESTPSGSAPRIRPRVVLLGVDMRRIPPFDAIRRTRAAYPETKIVVITRHDDAAWNAVAQALGADAVLGSLTDARRLALVVRAT